MKKLFLVLFFILFVIFYISHKTIAVESSSLEILQTETNKLPKHDVPKIFSRAAIVIDGTSGRVLFEKNSDMKMPMASTTKIMTAILTVEKGNLKDIVKVSKRAARVGGSTIHLKYNEQILLNDLLYGLMLNSGNDAAIAIAEHLGGSVENFAVMLTRKAKEIGAFDTNFITPHGLDNPNHYTTASDLAKITKYALKNKIFSNVVSTKETVIGNGKRLSNTNVMLRIFPGADGVKTGYTGKAGRCLVTSVTRNGWQLISVMLGSDSSHQRSSESSKILSYAFDNYKLVDLSEIKPYFYKIILDKSKIPYLTISPKAKVLFPISDYEKDNLQIEYNFPEKIKAPLKKGTLLGRINYLSSSNKIIKSISFYLNSDIEKKSVLDYFTLLLNNWLETKSLITLIQQL